MKSRDHIIQKQKIEIEFEDQVESYGIQNRVASLFYEKLLPKIELLFDDMFGEKYSASLDSVSIDCGIIEGKNWENDLTDIVLRNLKGVLITADKKEFVSNNNNEIFFFFLENGYLPWNSRIESIDEIERETEINQELVSGLRKLFASSDSAAERFIVRFSDKFYENVIKQYTDGEEDQIKNIYYLLNEIEDIKIDKDLVKKILLRTLCSNQKKDQPERFFVLLNNAVEEETKKLIEERLKNRFKISLKTDIDPSVYDHADSNKENPQDKLKNNGIYINNAGLVILHPFLPEFFERLGLTKNKEWINEEGSVKASVILDYLVFGNEVFSEFNFPLNKILCNIDLKKVVQRNFTLSEEIKTETGIFLKEIIKHWGSLRNTSIEAFRTTFLQRKGKLIKIDNGWLHKVETSALDILLEKIPWGIGIIKLPWMKEILYTEWG